MRPASIEEVSSICINDSGLLALASADNIFVLYAVPATASINLIYNSYTELFTPSSIFFYLAGAIFP